ncbi:PREDICTED: neuronal-specific septin-3 isoform X2 [Thamnophis sirtalis]|uniref:Neuronal-specific septin-3 n=1 Tax=Thamnophis sirtalis TaxID=35019 RepID=A0A6I9X149_9SAUR|nr:PREDICTED: neuronal-specific septin-3 isoform X2 [Thamnophis sirtalis]
MMDKGCTPSPHRIRRCLPVLGTSPHCSSIPGCSARSPGTGGLESVNPSLKKNPSFVQGSPKETLLAKGKGIPRPASRLLSPKSPGSHDVQVSCPPPTRYQSLQHKATNGLEQQKLSSMSFTFHQSNSVPPTSRQLIWHPMARREFQKVSSMGETPGRFKKQSLPRPQLLSGLQTLPESTVEFIPDAQTSSSLEDAIQISETETPDSMKKIGFVSFPSCQGHTQTMGKDLMNSILVEAVHKAQVSMARNGIPRVTLRGLSGSLKILPPFLQEYPEEQAVMDHSSMKNPTTISVVNATESECTSQNGSADTKPEAVMSELVPETRPKPVVPMKPVSINSNLLGYIGIDTIIEQMRKKTMKTGFDFNIMVVGQSGLGKSTLVNTLFKSQVSRKSSGWNREEKIPKTVEIKAIGHVIEECGVKMKLTVIDTPGFGDQINNENCWEPIEKYINEQYEKFLKEEVNIARKKRIPDTRVHCCLYFISPTGHSLRPLDMEFMKHLSKMVNIIPVIAKADTMTLEEKIEFKQRVRKELEVNGIEFYPQKEFDEDLEDKAENDKIRESMPFAVVGSDKEYQVNGKRVLGRKTPWGVIEVENLNHCEFALLRDFVIRTHLQDLKEVTHNIHYETYRAKRLNDNGGLPPVTVETEENHESNL